jgi:hypothetical protein
MSPCVNDDGTVVEGDITPVEGDIGQCRLQHDQRHDHNTIDHNVNILRQQFTTKYGTQQQYPPFKWQKSFHDHIIRDETDFNHHYHYAVYNFLKHGLPRNWKYTSLRCPEITDEHTTN